MTYVSDAKPGKPSARYLRHLAKEEEAGRMLRGSRVTPVVYFVRAETLGLIKIGATLDLSDRLKTLQVGSPDKLTCVGAIYAPDAFDQEKRLHARLRDHWSHGEWFHPHADILELIEQWPLARMEQDAANELRAALTATYSKETR